MNRSPSYSPDRQAPARRWRSYAQTSPLLRPVRELRHSLRRQRVATRKQRFFRRVVRLLDTQGLPCVVVGGYALEARRGRLSRPHKDVDVMALSEDRDAVVAGFERAGFTVRTDRPCKLAASDREGHTVDLFLWYSAGEGFAEHEGPSPSRSIVRVPRDVVTRRQRGRLGPLALTIPCDDYLRCVTPFMRNERDIAYCEALPGSPSLRLHASPALAPSGYTLFEWRRVGS